jgi:translocation protein SEC63
VGVVHALSSGEEFNEVLTGNKAENGLSKLEQKVLSEGSDSPVSQILTKKDRQKLDDLEDSRRRKVLTLLWAYLGRVELDDETLNDEKFEVAPIALRLNEAYTAIALAYGNTKAVLSAYKTSQNLIQALRPGASALEQIPHFTPEVTKAAEAEKSRMHLSIQDFMRIPDAQRKQRLVTSGLLSQEQYSTAMSVASRIPLFNVEKAFFKVVGERFVTPSSLVQFVLKGRFIPSGATDVPEINPKDLLDIDPEEGDVAAITGRKNDRSGEKPIQPPLAHAPYYARDHAPRWHIFLADSKQGRIAVPPFTFSTFDKPILDESGNPTYNVQTLKMQFGAPPQAGSYTFVMHMICDSYLGMDTKMEVTLVVEDASKAEQVEEEEEISEPEEGKWTVSSSHIQDLQKSSSSEDLQANVSADSLAGQMRQMKTGGAAPKKRKQIANVDDSSGSDTEGDVESESETDTDTDSDEE